jgi:hypothetical protein
MLHSGGLRNVVEIERDFETVGDGLLTVDVLSRGDSLLDRVRTAVGGLRIEINAVLWVGQRRGKIGAPGQPSALLRNLFELVCVSAYQQRARHDDFAVADSEAALLHDGVDRALQVLIQSHASSDAVHDDSDIVNRFRTHGFLVH